MPDTTGVVERTRREEKKGEETPNTGSVEAGKYINAARTAGTDMKQDDHTCLSPVFPSQDLELDMEKVVLWSRDTATEKRGPSFLPPRLLKTQSIS